MTVSYETVKRIYDLREDHGVTEIAQIVGLGRHQVGFWLGNPARFDPYIDEIAVERALLGERRVYAALTIWELRKVTELLADLLEGLTPTEAGRIYERYSQTWGVEADALRKRIERVRTRAAA